MLSLLVSLWFSSYHCLLLWLFFLYLLLKYWYSPKSYPWPFSYSFFGNLYDFSYHLYVDFRIHVCSPNLFPLLQISISSYTADIFSWKSLNIFVPRWTPNLSLICNSKSQLVALPFLQFSRVQNPEVLLTSPLFFISRWWPRCVICFLKIPSYWVWKSRQTLSSFAGGHVAYYNPYHSNLKCICKVFRFTYPFPQQFLSMNLS